MNYAYNLHQSELTTAVWDWMSTQESDTNTGKWLLFDGAVLGEKVTKKLIALLPKNTVHNIFFGTPLASYDLLSPHLIQLSHGSAVRNRIPGWLEHMNGVPAVSLLDASADLQTVCRHLSWRGQARTCDDMDLYCRFADTRVTPSLMRTLLEDQLAILGRCIHEWRIVDRHGGLAVVLKNSVQPQAMTTGERNADSVEQLRLSDKQFSIMMREAEADEIFQMLCEGASDLVPDDNHGDFYFRLSSLVAAGRRHGLEKLKDLYQFCVIALATSDEFYVAPELDECWSKMHAGMDDFGALVARWSDETWNALESIRMAGPTELSCGRDRHEST
jgi:hypothetical protein